jgi:hypothetical protein
MPQHTKPTSMSLSEWRLWCCCHPTITPPSSSLSQRENVSLEEFDPRNRWSTSQTHEPRPSTPLAPSTTRKSNEATPPAVSARLKWCRSLSVLRNPSLRPRAEQSNAQRLCCFLVRLRDHLSRGSRKSGRMSKASHCLSDRIRSTGGKLESECWRGRTRMARRDRAADSAGRATNEYGNCCVIAVCLRMAVMIMRTSSGRSFTIRAFISSCRSKTTDSPSMPPFVCHRCCSTIAMHITLYKHTLLFAVPRALSASCPRPL